jgi:hypothetical protein
VKQITTGVQCHSCLALSEASEGRFVKSSSIAKARGSIAKYSTVPLERLRTYTRCTVPFQPVGHSRPHHTLSISNAPHPQLDHRNKRQNYSLPYRIQAPGECSSLAPPKAYSAIRAWYQAGRHSGHCGKLRAQSQKTHAVQGCLGSCESVKDLQRNEKPPFSGSVTLNLMFSNCQSSMY